MKVGIFGHYTYGDYSDELIALAIKNCFKTYGARPVINYFGRGDYSKIDLAVLGGGSLLGYPLPHMINELKNNDCPFIILGTGVREFQDIKGLRYLWDRADLIAMRGKISIERLDKIGFDTSKISVCGDSIFLLESENLPVDDYIGGVFRPHGNMDSTWLYQAFNTLQELEKKPVRLLSFSVIQGDKGEQLSLGDAYYGVCASSFWFGNRCHPFCIALINGIPAMAVELEFRKIEDVCSTLGYPYWIKAATPISLVKAAYVDLMMNWPSIRKKVKKSVSLIREGLKDLVKEALTL